MTPNLAERIKNIVAATYGAAADVLVPETRFSEHPGIDDLDRHFMLEVEAAFGITLSDDDKADLHTVGDLVSIVERKLKVTGE